MNAGDFSTFVEAIHGYRPFPWQTELARRVVEGEGWPAMIAAPTAAGKTLVIDLAVFALACSVDSSARPPAPRRTFFVIDRRVVVDAAFDRAVRLAQALREPRHLMVAEVAERLLALGGEVPLETVALRGGVSLDQAWARSPVQPLVCVSTVDQVGSRLLFRGYGLGRGPTNLLPIHAALVGNDALIILDEAHLSRPFADTLSAVGRYRTWAGGGVTSPWIVVHMTATPEPGCEEPFTIGDEDRADSVLGPRLAAKKPARLIEVRTQAPQKGDPPRERRRLERENRAALVETICREALALLSHDRRARVVAVVVNRVAVAREIFESLRTEGEAILLTGRARPWERERLLERYLPRIEAGRKEDAGDGPLFVVATQTIEVGADLDFDGLVTECASLDALRQRFGRLDRLGERGESWAVIVSRRDQVARGAEDFVYGPSLGRTWSWLKGMAERPGGEGVPGNPVVDMGVMSLPMPAATELLELLPPARRAPVLLPAHLDLWTQTAPMPLPDPDPALFLHGPSTEPPDVSVVWRADLDEAPSDTWANIVALAPPTPPEAIPVPAYATRRWLTGADEEEIADVEGAQVRPGEEIGQGKVILRWRGPGSDETMPIGPAQVRPGDTIVVPASYGGADEFGWNPSSRQPVPDIAEAAFLSYRKRALLRLHPATLGPQVVGEETARQVRDRLGRLAIAIEREDARAQEKDLLEVIAGDERVPAWLGEAARALLRDPARRRLPYPDRRGIVLMGSRGLRPQPEPGFSSDEGDESSFTGAAVSLAAHCQGVADQARRFAASCGLPAGVVGDLGLAASLHDLGKVDPRFQVMLHGGDEVEAAIAEQPLAKSGMDPRDRHGLGSALAASELPRGYRHEATSLALLEVWPEALDEARVPDLVRHLVASHHGAARPFLPPVPDAGVSVELRWGGALVQARTAHNLCRLDSRVADRFWLLVGRYGWWGLAYLEAIVRLADHRRSQTEAEEGGWTS